MDTGNVPQDVIVDDQFEPLELLLTTLPIHDRLQLFKSLARIHTFSHIYYDEWKYFVPTAQILQNIVAIMQKYELNGLQLNGYACSILSRILIISPDLITKSQYSESKIIELIFRILVEHSNYLVCLSILTNLIRHDRTVFLKVCKIGIDNFRLPLSHIF